MDDIIDELRTWKKEYDSSSFCVNDIYEISVDSCEFETGWPTFKGPSAWMYEGMTNNTKPMWAISVGDEWGETLGFVWSTRVSQNDLTVQEIVGVNCELWRTDDICESSYSRPGQQERENEFVGNYKDTRE